MSVKVQNIINILLNDYKLISAKQKDSFDMFNLKKYVNGNLSEDEIMELFQSIENQKKHIIHEMHYIKNENLTENEINELYKVMEREYDDIFSHFSIVYLNYDYKFFKKILKLSEDNHEFAEKAFNFLFKYNYGFTSFYKFLNKMTNKKINSEMILKFIFSSYNYLDNKVVDKILRSVNYRDIKEKIQVPYYHKALFYKIHDMFSRELEYDMQNKSNSELCQFIEAFYESGCFLKKYITPEIICKMYIHDIDCLITIYEDNFQTVKLAFENINQNEVLHVVRILKSNINNEIKQKYAFLLIDYAKKNSFYIFNGLFDYNCIIEVLGKDKILNRIKDISYDDYNKKFIYCLIESNPIEYFSIYKFNINYLLDYITENNITLTKKDLDILLEIIVIKDNKFDYSIYKSDIMYLLYYIKENKIILTENHLDILFKYFSIYNIDIEYLLTYIENNKIKLTEEQLDTLYKYDKSNFGFLKKCNCINDVYNLIFKYPDLNINDINFKNIEESVKSETDPDKINFLLNKSLLTTNVKLKIFALKHNEIPIKINPDDYQLLLKIYREYPNIALESYFDINEAYEIYKKNLFNPYKINILNHIIKHYSNIIISKMKNESSDFIIDVINKSNNLYLISLIFENMIDKLDLSKINDDLLINLIYENKDDIVKTLPAEKIIELLLTIDIDEVYEDYKDILKKASLSNAKKLIFRIKCPDEIISYLFEKYKNEFNFSFEEMLELVYGMNSEIFCVYENTLIDYVKKNKLDFSINQIVDLCNTDIKFYEIFKDILNEYLQKDNIDKSIKNLNKNCLYDLLSFYVEKDKLEYAFIYIKLGFSLKYLKQTTIFFNKLGIESKYIIKYIVGRDDINWPNIICQSNIEEFNRLFNYMQNHYYKNNNKTSALFYTNLMDFIKYYPANIELFTSLCDSNKELTREDINSIYINLAYKTGAKSLKECYEKSLNIIKDDDNEEEKIFDNIEYLKEKISLHLFGFNYNTLKNYLYVYGRVVDLKIMRFNNRYNIQFDRAYLSYIIGLTSMMECIETCQSEENLQCLLNNCLVNPLECAKSRSYFYNYDQQIRVLYEQEAQSSLTKIDMLPEKYILKDKSDVYGVKIYDLSNSAYVLLAHVKSYKDDVDQLLNGNDCHEVISVSSVSYRNQHYYGGGMGLILGYSDIPDDSYIYGSTRNMSSNGKHKKYTPIIKEIMRKQRDVRSTSDAPYNNSEILLYRENLHPSCIIIHGDREPNNEELSIAKKYALPIVYTQMDNEIIKNPQLIENQDIPLVEDYYLPVNNIDFINKSHNRKIAVMTDAHGLYEPTLAVLEDMRKKGITEIYSLGDNIGFGPNPKEVMELLNEYNVKSIRGNHEEYVLNMEKYSEHLKKTGAYIQTKKELNILRNMLTSDQIEQIQDMPRFIELTLNDKKMLLCHYTHGYNSGKNAVENPDDYEIIFEGHKHRTLDSGNVKTLRSVGFDHSNDYAMASYVIIEETPDGYKLDTINVDYDILNMEASIELSNINDAEKDKMLFWTNGMGR